MKDTSKGIIDILIPSKVDDEEEEDVEPVIPPLIEFKEKYVSEHPYCTNWPTNRKEKNENF